jgi:hypothetical protein
MVNERWDDEVTPPSGPRFCANCGASRGAGAFCSSCGLPFDPTAAPPVASAPPQPTPPAQQQMQSMAPVNVYRAQVGWGCLGQFMVIAGAVLGFVAGAYLVSVVELNILLELAIGFVVGPIVGAIAGWYMWTELWGRKQ